MKKIIAILTILIGFNVNAGLIEVSATDDLLALNETTSVTVTGSGFSSINSLSFLFEFDTSIFAFDSTSVLFSAGIPLATELATGVNFGFIFFAPVSDFTLTFDLTAIGLGDGLLSVSNILAGFQSSTGGAPVLETADASGKQVAVSAPATLGLFALAGLFMAYRRRA